MVSFVALMGMKGVGEEFEQILRSARHPIENLSRLSRFARHEWRDVVVGHTYGDTLRPLNRQLIGEGRVLARLARRLARDVSRLLATHRQEILDLQMLQERVAWSAVELYTMAAVISRLQSMLNEPPADNGASCFARDLHVGKGYCHHAAERITRRLDDLFGNNDKQTVAVANSVLNM